MRYLLILSLMVMALHGNAQEESEPKWEMKTYYMVFLKTGPTRDQSAEEAKKIQAAHLNNIDKLNKEGKILMAGPFLDDGDIKGIFVMDCATKEEAEALCKTDPAVKAGRLIVEVHPWYSAKGMCLK